ncbi:MAG: efflux RND transporter periplasmic adaptor subunit [Desulfobulbus sp.]|jgi:membrane fusion protein (multidrug efflux system)|uniref:efflux RND transporter periplasmic adaptor subunit n=1 Tax=Desulfobulbus sp. TaxID=895 RepID=UPI002850A5A0|nr:efflux RND transporter periplasmic adaptor subunit [Desulfobulbus sp.]MDR2549931.1 efflux RND transporter periplasmic adaptor subunit [Desulfobulbus sp.]
MQKPQQRVNRSQRHCRIAHLAAAAFLAGTVCFTGGCKKEEHKAGAMVPTVETITVSQRDVPVKKEWVGVLDGMVNATIRPQVTGYLIRQEYKEGEMVRKGQVLFEIDPRPFQASLDKAKAQLSQQIARHETSKANLARIRPLAAKNAVSQKDLDDSVGTELSTRSAVEAAQAAVEEAKLDLSFTKIISPVDGVAGLAKTQLGDLVSPTMQEELTAVSTLDPIKAYINISEQEYLTGFRAGKQVEEMPLELILTDGSVYPYEGHIAIMDRQIDPTTGTMKIGALFPNKENRLRPGQYGRIRATVKVQKGALLVPQRAVIEVQGRYMVAVVGGDNKVEIRPVQMGARIDSDWIAEQGLKPGEQIVVEGIQKVRTGMPVTPKPFAPAAKTTAAPAEKR